MAEKQQKKSKIIVTGGAGFIGSNLVDALLELGDFEVHVIDNLETGKRENINPKAVFHEADIRDYDAIAPFFSGMDYVFHCAALPRIQTAIKDPVPAHHTNTTGTLNVLRAAQKASAKKLIYSGSSSVYGKNTTPFREDMKPDPLNPYAAQKFMGELYCRNFSELYGLPTVILRYFNVYGPREILEGAYATVIGIFRQQLKEGKPMTMVADGEKKTRDFTHVRDVVRANILAMESTKVGKAEIINIGTGKNYSITELTDMFGACLADRFKLFRRARERPSLPLQTTPVQKNS
ncbi:MAG: Nucleotide sugar epimerase [Parcubacteria group bacterium GW2011_GWC1_44_10]|nr:MAG: Nucleotide sugar epimerase [Parcubacteria group bacterium GW2011_GWC1_44_10]